MQSLHYKTAYAIIPVAVVLLNLRVTAFFFPVLGESSSSGQRRSSLIPTCMSQGISEASRTVQVLALHGSEGNGTHFIQQLEPLMDSLSRHHIELLFISITAPFAKGSGFAWWTMPPGVRSFAAKEFEGFETSASLVLDVMNEIGPFDVVLGHSQGAIMIAALLALKRISVHPRMGYILNGVAMPNPYRKELESLKVEDSVAPRVLFVFGENDKINPLEIGEEVKSYMVQAGFATSTCYHPGGHSVPVNDENALQTISKFVIDGISDE